MKVIKGKSKKTGIFMLLPSVILLFLLTTLPFAYLLFLGFCRWDLTVMKSPRFVGISNYLSVMQDKNFWNALRVTLIFVTGGVTIETFLGLGIALLLNKNLPGRRLIRGTVLLPMMITPAVIGLIWRILYHPQFGLINYFLNEILKIPSPLWLANPKLALYSLIIVDIWEWTPFMALTILAGLQALPHEPYEAGKIDGGSNLQLLWYITLPRLRPIILIGVSFRIVTTFRWFDTFYVMTSGGPGRATESLVYYSFTNAFFYFKMGYASTIAIIVLIFVVALSYLLVKFSGIEETEL